MRAVDILGEENDDEELLAWAAANGRAFVTSDDGIHAAAHKWLREGRAFRMIYWWAEHRRRMSDLRASRVATVWSSARTSLRPLPARTAFLRSM